LSTPSVRLGALTFDCAGDYLYGPAGPVPLRRKSFQVLRYLVDHSGRVVSKEEVLEAIWADVVVGEDSLAQCVTEIRRALGPTAKDILKTVPRRGYFLSVDQEPTTPASQTIGPALPRCPSIAVLPFANLAGPTEDDYFCDGIAEDIITELSRFSELMVIARNSSFQYDGRSTDVRQIGRELGVRYVLEGSVRRDEGEVRITAQLIEAETRRHVWAERYNHNLEKALTVQDRVAREVVALLAVHVKKTEIERALTVPPVAWQAYDYYLRAIHCVTAYHASYEKKLLFTARSLLKQALDIDPAYARALATLSSCYMSQWVHRWDDDCPWSEALDRSYETARESVRLAPELPDAHIALGQALTFLRQHDAAVAAVERAIALNPNLTSFRFAYTYILAGQAARAAELLRTHMRLDPFYEPNAPMALGFAYYMLGRYREGLPLLQEAVSGRPIWHMGATSWL
jgi:adenylate cyclase